MQSAGLTESGPVGRLESAVLGNKPQKKGHALDLFPGSQMSGKEFGERKVGNFTQEA